MPKTKSPDPLLVEQVAAVLEKGVMEEFRRRRPIRTTEVVLDGDYTGWTMQVRTNLRWTHLLAIGTIQRVDQAKEQLPRVIRAWNFVDEEGVPLPQPADGGFDELTSEEIVLCVNAIVRHFYGVEEEALPNA